MEQHPASRDLFVLRVGDREREAVLDQLGEHHVHGRLPLEELDRRQRAAMSAVTQADLAVLVADLPGLEHAPALPRARPLAEVAPAFELPRAAKYVGPPAVLVSGAMWVTSSGPFVSDEGQFSTALAMGALGFLTHWFVSRRG